MYIYKVVFWVLLTPIQILNLFYKFINNQKETTEAKDGSLANDFFESITENTLKKESCF
jgi:hypothetical protein